MWGGGHLRISCTVQNVTQLSSAYAAASVPWIVIVIIRRFRSIRWLWIKDTQTFYQTTHTSAQTVNPYNRTAIIISGVVNSVGLRCKQNDQPPNEKEMSRFLRKIIYIMCAYTIIIVLQYVYGWSDMNSFDVKSWTLTLQFDWTRRSPAISLRHRINMCLFSDVRRIIHNSGIAKICKR